MSSPTEIQYQQLKRLLSKLETATPIDCRQQQDGSVRVDVGCPHLIRDSGDMDLLLNQFLDVDMDQDPDDLMSHFREILDPFGEQ